MSVATSHLQEMMPTHLPVNLTSRSQKSKTMERLSEGLAVLWAGLQSLIWNPHHLFADDNPWVCQRAQPTGKISVNLPLEDWLCKNLEKLNLTLVEGYPCRSSDIGCLQRDYFVKNAQSQVVMDLTLINPNLPVKQCHSDTMTWPG